jgi:hypothetical protein
MRLAVGLLALALPLVLVLGEPLVFDGQPFPRGSLSAYYYSGVRELFVGMLWAIGAFLVTYKLLERSRESRASTYAGALIVLVAVFPTQRPGAGFELTPLQARLGETVVELVHWGAAGLALALLALLSYYFGRYGRSFRRFHYAAAGVIVAALALAALAGLTGEPDNGLLVAEVAAVLAFAASWLRTVELELLLGRA